jgi:hypothetical protein
VYHGRANNLMEGSMKAWLLLLALLLTGCGESADMAASSGDAKRMAAPAAPMVMEQAAMDGAASPNADTATPKYLAERQFWVFELPESAIETRWQAHVALCQADCEVLNAALNKSAHSPVSASLQIRIGRGSAAKLLGAMSSPEVTERRVEREDKTMQVVDVEARLKNLAELRDRLRNLLTQRSGALKDILETERELARVQSELDSMSAQRQALANETEKILLFAEYRPEPSIGETGAMQPLVEAWRGAGRAFAESLSAALLFIVQVLPWLVIVVPVVWASWKGMRRLLNWRRKTPPAGEK